MRLNSGRIALVIALLVTVTVSAGAPREVKVVFHSDPEGATLYANDSHQRFGYTPTILKYKTSKAFQRGNACDHVQGTMVRWASGVEATLDALDLCPDNGGTQTFTFVRPDLPGRDTDVLFALELTKVAAMQQAAEPPPVYIPYPTHCRSQLIGTQIFTTCY